MINHWILGVAYNISITRAQIPAEFGVSCHGTITPTQAKLLKAQKTGQPHAASCIMLPFWSPLLMLFL